jgi:hypothetical protein
MVSLGSVRFRRLGFYFSLSFELRLWGTLKLVSHSTFKYEPFKMFLVMLGVVKSLVVWLV